MTDKEYVKKENSYCRCVEKKQAIKWLEAIVLANKIASKRSLHSACNSRKWNFLKQTPKSKMLWSEFYW